MADELLDVPAGVGSDAFDHAAPLTDDDLLLALACDANLGADFYDAVFLHIGVDHHFTRIGDFLLEVGENFFADDLRDEKAHRLIRQLVLREIRRANRQMLHNSFEQLVDVEAVQRADGGDGRPGDFRLPISDAFAHIGLVLGEVNLIDEDEHRDVHVGDFGKRLRVREVVLVDVRDQQNEVGILKGRAHKFHHALLQFVGGVQNAGCIAVNDLPVRLVNEPHDAVPGGLRLFVDDAQAFTNELVHQSAFAHVG